MTRTNAIVWALVAGVLSASSSSSQQQVIPPGELQTAIARGVDLANKTQAGEIKALAKCKKFPNPATLIAEGDSWFEYPGTDVLSALQCEFPYRIETSAQGGRTLERMTYDPQERKELYAVFQELSDRDVTPKAVLISGGGNDIVGPELTMLLNHDLSGLEKLDPVILDRVVVGRLRLAMINLLTQVDCHSAKFFKRKLPILVHGYDYPIPDGRGYSVFNWKGPWIKPSLDLKSASPSDDVTQADVLVAKKLIDAFNSMLESITATPEFSHVQYVEILNTLDSELDSNNPNYYRAHWANELHPKDVGFELVAGKFANILDKLPEPVIPPRECSIIAQ